MRRRPSGSGEDEDGSATTPDHQHDKSSREMTPTKDTRSAAKQSLKPPEPKASRDSRRSSSIDRRTPWQQNVGSAAIIAGIGFGALCIMTKSSLTYMGLILSWALSVILFQW